VTERAKCEHVLLMRVAVKKKFINAWRCISCRETFRRWQFTTVKQIEEQRQ
jgi:hypothetical protein